MAKTERELSELKEMVEELKKELKELSEDELEQVSGGRVHQARAKDQNNNVKRILHKN